MKKFMIIYIFFLLGSFVSTKCLAQDVAWIEGCAYEDGNSGQRRKRYFGNSHI